MDEIKVMIVDDEVEFAEAMAERLELRGFQPNTVNCGRDALEILSADFLPDVILLDLKMPDMSGFDVLVEVKEKYPSIQVIMLTGHGAASSGNDSIDQGAFAFIMKPVELSEITAKIQEAYAQRQTA